MAPSRAQCLYNTKMFLFFLKLIIVAPGVLFGPPHLIMCGVNAEAVFVNTDKVKYDPQQKQTVNLYLSYK